MASGTAEALARATAGPLLLRRHTYVGAMPEASITAPELAAGVPWRHELASTVRLATPMALIQLGQIAMMTTDLILVGRLGDRPLAAAALAHTVLFACFTAGMGLVAAVAPLAAQAFGAGEPRMVRRALRVGLWAACAVGTPMALLQLRGGDILLASARSRRRRRSPDATSPASLGR